MALLLMCLFTSKIEFAQVKVSFLYYCTTIAYASFFIGDLPAWADHAIYALLAAPFIFISTIFGAATILAYSIFNILVAIDYILYPNIDTIISNNFGSSQLLFASLLIIGSIFKSKMNDYRIADGIMDWLGGHKNVHRSLSKMEKHK